MTERLRRCKGVIKNPKDAEQGRPCRRWAVNGEDYCAVHSENPRGAFFNPDSLTHRCIARSVNTGSQCKKAALRGTTVCRTHGGYNPAVRAKAQERIDQMVEPVLWQLRAIALSPGTSTGDRLRAIQMVLDRALPKERKVEVELKPWEILFQQSVGEDPDSLSILRQVPDEIRDELEVTPTYQHYVHQIIDAEVLNEDEPDEYEEGVQEMVYIAPTVPGARASVVPGPRVGSAEPPRRHRHDSPFER